MATLHSFPASSPAPPESPARQGPLGSSCPGGETALALQAFVDFLSAHSHQHGTALTPESLPKLLAQFQDSGLTGVPPSCVRLHEQMAWDEQRRRPFERLLVKRFAHHFPRRAGDDGSPTAARLSRRVIPGFLLAVVKMVGGDSFAACEAATREHLNRYRQQSPGPLDWSAVAQLPPLRRLVDLALVAMAAHFSDFDKRLSWLIEIVNSHLPPPLPEESEALRGVFWSLTPPTAVLLLSALYEDLERRTRQDALQLEHEVGHYGLTQVRRLHHHLAQYHPPIPFPPSSEPVA